MAGGLLQLVAYGPQDLFLTKDPQITFFKIVYRRHTNFSTEVIPQYFTHTPDFGKRITCVLSKNGDLVARMHLVIVLPDVPQFRVGNEIDNITKFAWIRRIGYGIINNIEVEIGGELIDRQYGDWLNIWHDLTMPSKKNINQMLGDVKELTEFTNGKKSYKLFIPLQFWFNRLPGLALPIIALQYNHVKINLELNDINNCFVVVPTHYIGVDNDFVNFKPFEFITQDVDGVVSLARFIYFDIINRYLYLWRYSDNGFLSVTVSDSSLIDTEEKQRKILYARDANGNLVNEKYFIVGLTTKFLAMPLINAVEHTVTNRSFKASSLVIKQAYILVEYIFLDDEERVKFSQAKHEYLIEQVAFNGENTITGINQSFKLGFNKPCKEVQWVTQLTNALNTRINATFNYTDSLLQNDVGVYIGKNIILREAILFNGQERVTLRESSYYTNVQVYQNHTNGLVNIRPPINVYAFALFPEKHQPSCAANLSKIDNILLQVQVNTNINFKNTVKLRPYAILYNVLRIVNGISGLVFSNDENL